MQHLINWNKIVKCDILLNRTADAHLVGRSGRLGLRWTAWREIWGFCEGSGEWQGEMGMEKWRRVVETTEKRNQRQKTEKNRGSVAMPASLNDKEENNNIKCKRVRVCSSIRTYWWRYCWHLSWWDSRSHCRWPYCRHQSLRWQCLSCRPAWSVWSSAVVGAPARTADYWEQIYDDNNNNWNRYADHPEAVTNSKEVLQKTNYEVMWIGEQEVNLHALVNGTTTKQELT